MAALTVQSIVRTGLAPTYVAAAAGGDTIAPGAGTFLHVKNGGGSPINVTLVTPSAIDPAVGIAITDLVVAVPNGSERMIGPLPGQWFADTVTGLVPVAYSAVTSVTVAALNLSQP